MLRIAITKYNQVTIQSDNVRLISLNQMSLQLMLKYYEKLLSNPINVKLFLDGKPWTKKQVEDYVNLKYQKWLDGDPYSSFAVFDSKTNNFIGTLNLDYQKNEFAFLGYKNVINIGVMIDAPYASNGLGSKIANIAKEYILKSLTTKPEINATKEILKREPPSGALVTVHPNNIRSILLILKCGVFTELQGTTKMGGRYVFFGQINKPEENKNEKEKNTLKSEATPRSKL